MIVNAYDAIGCVSTMALLGWFLWLVFKEPLLGKRPPEPDTTSSYKEPGARLLALPDRRC